MHAVSVVVAGLRQGMRKTLMLNTRGDADKEVHSHALDLIGKSLGIKAKVTIA